MQLVNKLWTDRIPVGQQLTVTADNALVELSRNGIPFLTNPVIATTSTFGPFNRDVNVRVNVISGVTDATIADVITTDDFQQETTQIATGAFRLKELGLKVVPSATARAVYVADRVVTEWAGTVTQDGGSGWVSARETILNLTGTGSVGKAVAELVQCNVTTSSVTALLGHESEIASIANGVTIGSYASYYVPNLAGVANIGNVGNFYAFACDYTEARIKHAGIFQNAALVEITPPHHPGLVTGRYYSASHDTISANAVNPNVVYFVPVFVPHRTTVVKLGFTVTTLGAGNARLAIYRAKNGVPENLIIDAGTVSVSTTGDKEITISQRLDSGMYFLAANFSVACSINWHSGGQAASRQCVYGSSSATVTGAALEGLGYLSYAFGAYPASVNTLSYTNQQAEPHLWFRV